MSDSHVEVFAGAQRRERYDERSSGSPVARSGETGSPGDSSGRELAFFQARPVEPPASTGAWQSLLVRLGMGKASPDAAELADRENERAIRQAVWTRAMNVIVMNKKGSSCKTPATIIVAGVLASIRGGYVAAWEAGEAPGDLADRAEGDPARGLTELLAAASMVTSAGNLAGYTAPQTSHAAIVGTVSARDELRPQDVFTVRRLLDAYYHVTVTDTANNDQSPTFLAALDTADAVLIPCTLNLQSLRGLQRGMLMLDQRAGQVSHLKGITSRSVVVVSHDGGPEDAELATTAVETIRQRYTPRAVIEVPYDPAIRRDGEITLADLSPASQRAWRAAARHLVEALQQAPEPSPIPAATADSEKEN